MTPDPSLRIDAPQPIESESDYLSQVIDAAYLYTFPNCYYVGPFASRVSFTSQQCRSIDLIEGLAREGQFTDRVESIAVVGAGLSGVTLATALLNLRRAKNLQYRVYLFEKSEGALRKQMRAAHRIVHPTISNWPFVALEHTTRLPFLDWFVAPCSDVMKVLLEEWKEIEDVEFKEGWLKPNYGTEVTKISPVHPIQPLGTYLEFEIEPETKIPQFDFVFMTTGYGPEVSLCSNEPSQKMDGKEAIGVNASYWEKDPISETATLNMWRTDRRTLYISGCGDGGLIDCLRFIHSDFRNGALSIELAEAMDSQPGLTKMLADQILYNERAIQRALKAKRCLFPKSKSKMKGRSPKVKKNWEWVDSHSMDIHYLNELQRSYESTVTMIPDVMQERLFRSIQESNIVPGRLVLMGHGPNPYGPNSAPIHKVMLAHALSRKSSVRPRYVQGSTMKFVTTDAEVSAGKLTFENGTSRRTETQNNCRVIIRNGAKSNIVSNVEESELHSLQVRQILLADFVHAGPTRWKEIGGISNVLTYKYVASPEATPRRKAMRSRFKKASTLLRLILPGARLSLTDEGFRYRTDSDREKEEAPLRLRVPTEVFSFPLVKATEPLDAAELL